MPRVLPWALSLLLAGAAAASEREPESGDDSVLVALINAYREAPAECEGGPAGAGNALVGDTRLARLGNDATTDPASATRAAGYAPAKVQIVHLGGPEDPESAMRMLVERYCRVLRDPEFNHIGVTRDGTRWEVVLARPVIEAGLADWREAGNDILEEINQARSQSRLCGSVRHGAAEALVWNDQLAQAALAHGRDMAARNYFSHVSRNGMTLSGRIDQTGYSWTRVGENIAAGSGSTAQTVAGWLDSPSHCATLMNPDFTETGVAYAIGEDSDQLIYWVQVFASPD